MSDSETWKETFSQLFEQGTERYRSGHQKASGLLESSGADFLRTIGYTEQEFFDFVEDFCKAGEPTLEAALSIAAVRREYFLKVQNGVPSSHRIAMDDLPAKEAELDGIGWLPRITAKAEAKLRGEMPPDLMYGCGGDRKFFKATHVDPAEFLRQTWKFRGDEKQLTRWVKAQSAPK